MPSLPTEVFQIDRRSLLRIAGTMGVGATFLSPAELFAAGACERIELSNGAGAVGLAAGVTVQYWLDGLHLSGRSDLPSRANLTLFMDLTQAAGSFVECVVLMDAAKQTLGARYFDASTKMQDGHVPYVRFENLALDATATYTVIYAVRNGSAVKLYTATIVNPELSRLNTTWIPQAIRSDLATFLYGGTANPTPGLVTTPFQNYTKNGLDIHSARARVVALGTDGSFSFDIDFMHGDVSATHYMRYFLVMDPVGRLLGLEKRNLGDPSNGGSGGTWRVSRLTDAQKSTFVIPPLQVANILDCPYVQIFTDDSYDGCARTLLRLR